MRSHLVTIGLTLAAATVGAVAFAQLEVPKDGPSHRTTLNPQASPVGLAVTIRPRHGYPIPGTLIDFSRDWVTLRDSEDRTYWIPRDTVWYIETRAGKRANDAQDARVEEDLGERGP